MASLVNQTYPPAKIVVVNDGSTDGTRKILEDHQKRYPGLIEVIDTDSTTRDYRRIPLLWNKCLRRDYDYQMIAAGDVIFALDYAEKLLKKMKENTELVICSGDYGSLSSSAPHGAGRFIRQSFFYQNYEKYPPIVGYETEILERALMNSYQISVVRDATFEHLDRLGHSHNFSEFGYAMRALGYYPPYVFGRFVIDFFYNKSMGKKGALQMLRYYLSFRPQKDGYYSVFSPDIRHAIRERQKVYIKKTLRRKVRKAMRRLLHMDSSRPNMISTTSTFKQKK